MQNNRNLNYSKQENLQTDQIVTRRKGSTYSGKLTLLSRAEQ